MLVAGKVVISRQAVLALLRALLLSWWLLQGVRIGGCTGGSLRKVGEGRRVIRQRNTSSLIRVTAPQRVLCNNTETNCGPVGWLVDERGETSVVVVVVVVVAVVVPLLLPLFRC